MTEWSIYFGLWRSPCDPDEWDGPEDIRDAVSEYLSEHEEARMEDVMEFYDESTDRDWIVMNQEDGWILGRVEDLIMNGEVEDDCGTEEEEE